MTQRIATGPKRTCPFQNELNLKMSTTYFLSAYVGEDKLSYLLLYYRRQDQTVFVENSEEEVKNKM